jgi:hypothetical protein
MTQQPLERDTRSLPTKLRATYQLNLLAQPNCNLTLPRAFLQQLGLAGLVQA